MSLKWQHLVGRDYNMHSQNCLHTVRDFYRDNYGIQIRDYACPKLWWDHGYDLYSKFYHTEGFISLDLHPREYEPGDVVMIAHSARVANHLGVLLDNGKILHHFIGQRSTDDPYSGGGYWRSKTVGVLRHKDRPEIPPAPSTDLWSLLPDNVRSRLDQYRPTEHVELPAFSRPEF